MLSLNLDLAELIKTVGYAGLFIIVFAESGVLIGFLLPGGSILFTAGFLASQGFLDWRTLVILLFPAAVLGDSFGYAFGRKVGPKIFKKEDSLLFHKHYLVKAERFYERHGGKIIVLARFMPLIRTFAPIVAGVGRMNYTRFMFFNILGGFLWTFGVLGAGYFLGTLIPGVDKYLLPIIGLTIFLSVLPSVVHVLKEEKERQKVGLVLKKAVKRVFG